MCVCVWGGGGGIEGSCVDVCVWMCMCGGGGMHGCGCDYEGIG